MEDQTALKLPPTGWQLTSDPCTECLVVIERNFHIMSFPGRSVDCYSCQAKLTVVQTEKQGPSIHDRYSGLVDYEESIRSYKLVELLFARRNFTDYGTQEWLASRELTAFQKTGSKGSEWDVFTKTNDPEALIFVQIEDGLIGRCVMDVAVV